MLKLAHDDPLVRSTITFAGLETYADTASVATFRDPTAGQLYVLSVHAVDAAGEEHRGHPPEGQTIGPAMESRKMEFVFPLRPEEVWSLPRSYRRIRGRRGDGLGDAAGNGFTRGVDDPPARDAAEHQRDGYASSAAACSCDPMPRTGGCAARTRGSRRADHPRRNPATARR